MISLHDLYVVLTAMVPLYVAMILAYGSVRWWKIFTPDQCSGINRFVAIFAVPLLSFHFISSNNIYAMNFKFIAADSLQKVIMLVILSMWANFTKNGSLEWSITIFSLSTLPNTLVMGIPLLISMYGEYSGSLMVQVVVLQCIIWYTLLLFLFEYRGAKMLIMEQFPETAASIVSFKVESDVVSLDGQDFLETDAEIGNDGKLHVTVRKSNASRRSLGHGFFTGVTPRPSNLTGAEIYSLNSSRNPTPRASNFNHSDFYSMMGFGGRLSNFVNSDTGRLSNYNMGDMYSVQSSRGPTPRPSNFEENCAPGGLLSSPKFGRYPGKSVPSSYLALNPEICPAVPKKEKTHQSQLQQQGNKHGHDEKELHMFVWSSSASPVSEGRGAGGLHVFGGPDFGVSEQSGRYEQGAKEIKLLVSDNPKNGETKGVPATGHFGGEDFSFNSGGRNPGNDDRDKDVSSGLSILGASSATEFDPRTAGAVKSLPPASVMTRLILIMVWRKLIRNPNSYSSLIGLIWSLVSFRWGVQMPKIVAQSISILSDAGLGMAMFSLGLFMALQPKLIACGNTVASFAMAVRFLTGPAVMAVASIAVGLRGTLLHVAIVQIYLPTKLERNQFFECKLTLGARYVEICKKIVSFLNRKEIEYLVECTQFGNLIICAKDYNNSNQLLWFLMSRQTYDSESNEFWMIYRKQPLRFSLLEYCLLTGLNCSNIYPMIPVEDEFRLRHFGESDCISLGDLIDKIDEYENDSEEEIDIEKLKLACLLFVVGVLGRQRKIKNDSLNLEWIRLVNNFDSFINYPWGRIAFEEVIYGLRKDLETKFRSYENLVARRGNDPDFSGCGSFHISGFIHPLQILAYEYFPAIGEVFAVRRKGPNVPIPRMCHWLTRKWSKNHSPSMDDVNKAFKNVYSKDIFGMLIPTTEELLSVHYMTGNFVDSNNVIINRITELICQGIKVVCTQDPLGDLEDEVGVQTETHDRALLQPFTYTYSRSSRDKVKKSSRPSRPSHMNQPSPPSRHRDHASLADIYELRFTSLEDKVGTIIKDQADIKNQLKNMQNDISSLKDMFGRLPSMSANVDQGQTSRHGFEDIPFMRLDDVDPNIRLVQDPSFIRAFEKTTNDKLRLFTVEEEPMTDEELRHLLVNDMMSLTFEKRVRVFVNRSWPRVSAEINSSMANMRISGMCSSYDSSWFRELGTPACWLTETHIQECCRGLIQLQTTYKHLMSLDVSLMNVDFHQLVLIAFNEGGPSNVECLMPYVRAEIDEWPAIPWNKANIILIPFHLPGHWVLLKVLPNHKSITVMDSDRSVDRLGTTLHKFIKPLSLMLPHMLGVDASEEWSIARPNTFPTQKISGECGVYCLAAAAYTMFRENAYQLNDAKIEEFRHYCCCCIWDKLWSLD